MKILVTGVTGQLGCETVLALKGRDIDVQGVSRARLDFSRPEQVESFFTGQEADWVINCAAYTQVDAAESDAELAFLVNRDSAAAVAKGVKKAGGRLLHVSTDFVFSGDSSRPYREGDRADPLGVYGQSKWQGEQRVREVLENAIILRTGWVYGIHGQNFVKTILRLAAQRDELRVIDDQVGTPSYTGDIAAAMWALIGADATGTYHFSNEGVASWFDFAEAIVEYAKQLGMAIVASQVTPIPTEAYPTPAARPAYSVLSKKKIRAELGYSIAHWRQGLQQMLRELQRMEAQ
jgi:dTDP-4-dehydrorhamnose reductase